MLGRKVEVRVLGSIPYTGLYAGYYMSGTRRKNVLVISKDEPDTLVMCNIIAIAQSKVSTQTRLVAAPEGQILSKKDYAKSRAFVWGK